MKHNFLYLMFLFGLVSCTDEILTEENSNIIQEAQETNYVNYRSYAEALEIAQNSISMLENDEADTRGGNTERVLNLENGVRAILQEDTRAGITDADNDTLIYIFNFKDKKGFAVVSACRQTDGLIAVVESDSYEPGVLTGNPGFDSFMKMAELYVANESKNKFAETRASANPIMCKPVYDTIFNKRVTPKISVKWGQKQVMGQFCPNKISGCTNTAIAQIMSYFKYPSSISLTYSGRDVNTTSLDWAAMCNHTYTYVNSNRDTADIQIGRLARQLGKKTDSTYGSKSTSATISNARSALSSLGYTVGKIKKIETVNNNIDRDDMYTLANDLAQNRLIYMRGENKKGRGHAWVVDGCYYVKALYRLMATYDGETWSVFKEMGTYRTCHNHINWGWNGMHNGYFNGWIFNANMELEEDPGLFYNSYDSLAIFIKDFKYFAVTH